MINLLMKIIVIKSSTIIHSSLFTVHVVAGTVKQT